MELLPQSREALDEYVAAIDDLEHELRTIEGWAVRTVPECIAMSVTFLDDDVTFTMVDALAPAPLCAAEREEESAPVDSDLEDPALDEERWARMARGGASTGIASSVSLPVVHHGRVVLSIDLYASTKHAFQGRLDALADALGASQAGAVTNADLGFATRTRAEEAPGRLRDQRLIDVGVGLLAAREGVDVDTAQQLLEASARAAGITVVQAALVLHTLHQG